MTQHMIPHIRGATIGGRLDADGHGAMPEAGAPMCPEWQATYERQAAALERDLNKYGLDLPSSGKLSIKAVDAALAGAPIRKRLELKSALRQFGVIDA